MGIDKAIPSRCLETLKERGQSYVYIGLIKHTPSPSHRGELVGGIFAFGQKLWQPVSTGNWYNEMLLAVCPAWGIVAVAHALQNTTKKAKDKATLWSSWICYFLCVFAGGTISGKPDPADLCGGFVGKGHALVNA